MKAWKCYNCEIVHGSKGGRDFESEEPVCHVCGADGRTVEGYHAVVARVVLHFDPPTAIYGKGRNVLACNPTVKIIANKNSLRATGDHREVTCEACKSTRAWLEASQSGEDLSNAIITAPVNQPPEPDPVLVSAAVGDAGRFGELLKQRLTNAKAAAAVEPPEPGNAQ